MAINTLPELVKALKEQGFSVNIIQIEQTVGYHVPKPFKTTHYNAVFRSKVLTFRYLEIDNIRRWKLDTNEKSKVVAIYGTGPYKSGTYSDLFDKIINWCGNNPGGQPAVRSTESDTE
jgi:hypothetical protein